MYQSSLCAVLSCLLITAIFSSGCASRPPAHLKVLVPGEGTREDQVVELPSNWAAQTVRALRASPGCLGVDLTQTQGGKRSIFAMFKDKAAVTAWYRHESHQALVSKVSFYRDHDHVPAAGIADNEGPILVIATMTPAPSRSGIPAGAVLLSVELFRPLPGGVQFGGATFLPR